MSKLHTSIVRALETAGLTPTEYMHIESDPILAQGITTYIKEYLSLQSSTSATSPQTLEPAGLRGYYDAGPLDHQFGTYTLLPWATVLGYDVVTLFGDIKPSDSQFAAVRSILAILHREGVKSIRDLLLLNESLLQDFRQLGPGKLKTIVSQLAKRGMRLTDQQDLRDEQWINSIAIRYGGSRGAETASRTSLPYESFCNLSAARFLPDIHASAGRAGVKVGDLVEFQPDKTVVLSLNADEGRKYVSDPDRLRRGFEEAGFRVVVK